MPGFTTPAPTLQYALLSFPAPYVLLVTLNRPHELNCINAKGTKELQAVWEWMDEEPSLRVGVLTGRGRAFCVGVDLKEWKNETGSNDARPPTPTKGFGGLSGRQDKKPVICAVNGLCLGGGTEIIVNSDLVVAASRASFGLPEVKYGMIALASGLPRLIRTVGKHRAMEMVLTGRTLRADEAKRWGLVNDVVAMEVDTVDDEVSRRVVERAVQLAAQIVANSPDAVYVSREFVRLSSEAMALGADEAASLINDAWAKRLYAGENSKEGWRAFVEKRTPVWVDTKL